MVRRLWQPHDVVQRKKWHILFISAEPILTINPERKQCKGHRGRKEYVDDDVLRLIQTHMKTVLDTEKMIQEMNAASKNQTQYLLFG